MAPSIVPTDYDVKSLPSSGSDYNGPSVDAVTTLPLVGKDTKDELPDTGMMCEVKNLWEGEKKCSCCVNWVEEYPRDVKPNPEETEDAQSYALLVRNTKSHSSTGKAMQVHTIIVQSPLLKPMLEEVFEGYDGVTATLKRVTFTTPFAPFFYRWSRFKRAVESQTDEQTRAHAQLLYSVLSNELDETISTYQDLLSHGVITFKYLWTLFQPGDLILCRMDGEEMLTKLYGSEYESGGMGLYTKYIQWDGYSFGYASINMSMQPFEGTRPITDLDAYPLQFNSEAGSIESRLAARGRIFEHLQGYHYKSYKGYAELAAITFGNRPVPKRQRMVDSRIIIDSEMYSRFNLHESIPLEPLGSISFAPKVPAEIKQMHHASHLPPLPPPPPHPGMLYPPQQMMPTHMQGASQSGAKGKSKRRRKTANEHPYTYTLPNTEPKLLSEDLYPICSPTVKGYCLKTKTWAKFKVDQVQEITWDNHAFDSLVLRPGCKELILSFTKSQNECETLLDDVIEGKGQGIVMLLTGEPGVGKTLTAESVAEHMRVPLYSMSAAQLGVDSQTVEQALGDILEMVTKWKAILLLDETEVFIEQRTIDGLERNKLVSIFLRMLEYYRGVLFLTTNRVEVLDKALDSRIHLKISYPELDRDARLKVWHNLIGLLPPGSVGLDATDLAVLAERSANGREIKNTIKAAQLLANGQGTTLNLSHIDTVLRITQIGGEDFVSSHA
ncbi:P-loop containing nucleoside triphosphate hydrolase protein [Dendryphion nanum]|uniref:P-loop containing nucleoside triphosphate hydrolase protein n=1 Tax=Dendryphion nanum TaxID=256645 RepID=A0A9P9D5Z5_9PLEO|nr:P-loop containing nucleoside triphosphate hydrolase protein [Dendryphion nanum]